MQAQEKMNFGNLMLPSKIVVIVVAAGVGCFVSFVGFLSLAAFLAWSPDYLGANFPTDRYDKHSLLAPHDV